MNNNLSNTNVNIEPVGCIFNVTTRTLEMSITEYFTKQGIDVKAVKSDVKRRGRGNEEVHLYVFFEKYGKEIISNHNKVAGVFADKLGSSSYRPSEKLKSALRTISKNGELGVRGNLVYAKLDVFRCLGLALDVNIKTQSIYINEVQTLGKDGDAILSVIKALRTSGSDNGNGRDIYKDIINSIER